MNLIENPRADVLEWPTRETYEGSRTSVRARIERALAESPLSNGAQVRELESTVAEYCGARFCVAMASATAGLMLAIRALMREGHGNVAVPAFAFSAPILACLWNSKRPLCLDVDLDSLNLSATALSAATMRHAIDGVLAIGVAGDLTGLDEIARIARNASIPFVLDAAACLGADLGDVPLGEIADAAVISLSSRKVLPAGEGGLVLTNSSDVAEKLRRLRTYGSINGYMCYDIGLNARLSEMHAAAALGAFEGLPDVLRKRQEWGEETSALLSRIGGVTVKRASIGGAMTWNDIVLRVPISCREAILQRLNSLHILAVPLYDPLIFKHPAFSSACTVDVASIHALEDLAKSIIAIPVFSVYNDAHQSLLDNVFRRGLISLDS